MSYPPQGTPKGTVTSVSVTTANGISGSIATPTTTPAITLTLGNITPTTVNGLAITTTAGTLTIANNALASLITSGNFAITLTATGNTNVTLPTSGTLVGTTNSQTLTIKKYQLATSLGSDLTAEGTIINDTVGENVAFGNSLYIKSDAKWWKSDADASATMPIVGIALATITADNAGEILILGTVRNDAWTWTVGGLIYASATTGALTQTAPSTSGQQVQIVGVAKSATHMIFNPSYNIVQIV